MEGLVTGYASTDEREAGDRDDKLRVVGQCANVLEHIHTLLIGPCSAKCHGDTWETGPQSERGEMGRT